MLTTLRHYGASQLGYRLFRPGREWEDRLFIQMSKDGGLPARERLEYWMAEKITRDQFMFFDDFKNHSLEPYFPGEFSPKDATPIWSVREHVPFNSMQLVGYPAGIIEIDFDIGNPAYGPLSALVHMVEFLHPGKTDPSRIAKALRKRGIPVRDMRQVLAREADRVDGRSEGEVA